MRLVFHPSRSTGPSQKDTKNTDLTIGNTRIGFYEDEFLTLGDAHSGYEAPEIGVSIGRSFDRRREGVSVVGNGRQLELDFLDQWTETRIVWPGFYSRKLSKEQTVLLYALLQYTFPKLFFPLPFSLLFYISFKTFGLFISFYTFVSQYT